MNTGIPYERSNQQVNGVCLYRVKATGQCCLPIEVFLLVQFTCMTIGDIFSSIFNDIMLTTSRSILSAMLEGRQLMVL